MDMSTQASQQLAMSQLAMAKANAGNRATQINPQTVEAAKEFEAVFLGQFVQTMFSGLSSEEPFGGGSAEEMWRQKMAEEIGRGVANNGGVGIAEAVLREMVSAQEAAAALRPAPPAAATLSETTPEQEPSK